MNIFDIFWILSFFDIFSSKRLEICKRYFKVFKLNDQHIETVCFRIVLERGVNRHFHIFFDIDTFGNQVTMLEPQNKKRPLKRDLFLFGAPGEIDSLFAFAQF